MMLCLFSTICERMLYQELQGGGENGPKLGTYSIINPYMIKKSLAII